MKIRLKDIPTSDSLTRKEVLQVIVKRITEDTTHPIEVTVEKDVLWRMILRDDLDQTKIIGTVSSPTVVNKNDIDQKLRDALKVFEEYTEYRFANFIDDHISDINSSEDEPDYLELVLKLDPNRLSKVMGLVGSRLLEYLTFTPVFSEAIDKDTDIITYKLHCITCGIIDKDNGSSLNEETIEAMKELEDGGGEVYDSADDLMDELN